MRHGRAARMPLLSAAGAVLAACAVALSAYAAHAATGAGRERLFLAAMFAFGHGIALASLGTDVPRRLGRIALAGLLVGTLLFAGSLASAALSGTPTTLAPFGGGLMIVGWLAFAVDRLRD